VCVCVCDYVHVTHTNVFLYLIHIRTYVFLPLVHVHTYVILPFKYRNVRNFRGT
jgi:hypothetical protein